MTANLFFDGTGCEGGFQAMLPVLHEEHAGIVDNGGIENHGQFAFGQAYGQWIDGQRVGKYFRKPLLVVVTLKREAPALTTAVVVHIGHEGGVVAGEVELRSLVDYRQLTIALGGNAVGGGIVVGTELYAELAVLG